MLKAVQRRLRALELSLGEVEPKTVNLATMVSRIEDAHAAADQLPADLQDLKEKRDAMADFLDEATQDLGEISKLKGDAGTKVQDIKDMEPSISQALTDANNTLAKCEAAYSASTSVGLGAAFSERSGALLVSIRWWVAGLVGALGVGGYFGVERLNSMANLLNDPKISGQGIVLNLFLTLLSVGGSVWFAWLATRQIGQRFKLAEDYAFKASISRAYEGYRKEANRIDPSLEAKLLKSALDRLDEQPIRWVEPDTHSSPMHELLSSGVVRNAVNSIPAFSANVKTMAKDAIEALQTGKKSSAAAAPIVENKAAI